MTPLNKLIDYLKADKVIPVIGAGFSYAVAKLPGWKGVIENGLQYASDRSLPTGTELSDAQQLLNSGKLVQGASIMKRLLNAPGHPFAEWLEEMFANPVVVSEDLIHAVNDLCTSFILTTNYDDLLYSKSRLRTKKVLDWSEQQETAREISKHRELILHLHGVYEKPETIILSEDDYTMLATQAGYKANLQKLWTDYHFLFVGCSKDGVMDEDFSTIFKFLNQWFPSVPNEHFILLHQSEIDKGVHRELMKQCNVQAISYGTDYNNLPAFINQLNPNRDKLKQKMTAIEQEIKEAFQRELLLSSGEFTKDATSVNSFLKENLPSKTNWMDSLQLKVLDDVLKEHNNQIASQKEQFRSYQAIMQGLVSVNDLNDQLQFWQQHSSDAAALNNDAFINLALLAYECLNRMPAELAEALRHRARYAIHEYYFDGYLGQFIESIKTMRGPGYAFLLVDDKYMFENLKRVISSLTNVLELNADEVFPDLKASTITNALPESFLIFLSDRQLSIRTATAAYTELAVLHAELALGFGNTAIAWHNGNDHLVITYNSQQCLYWNPVKDIAPVIFYTVPAGKRIFSIIKISEEGPLSLLIDLGYEIVKLVDFKQSSQAVVDVELLTFTYSQLYKRMLGIKNLADNIQGPALFDVKENGLCVPLFTKYDIWNSIKTMPEIESFVKQKMEFQEETAIEELYGFPFVRDFRIQIEQWNQREIALMSLELRMLQSHTVLIGFDLSEPIPSIVFRVLLPGKQCVAAALVHTDSQTDLLCGYLDMGNSPSHLLEYIPRINENINTVATNAALALPKEEGGTMDIVALNLLSSHRALALQSGGTIYDIQLPELTYSENKVDGVKKLVAVGF